MRDLLRRIWYIVNRRRMEREMADEMEYHRELMAADGRSGFGNDLRLREVARDVWGWSWFDRLGQDLTYGWRVLRNSPGFTVTAMLVLALGIGVPLTAFRAVMADVTGGSAPDPDTLVQLTRRAPGMHITVMPYPELAFYAANARSFRQVIGMSTRNQGTFGETVAGSLPESIHVSFVTANYFPEFGITAAFGRLWTQEDDERPESEAVALIGEQFWKRRLGGAPGAIGQTIRVNGKLVSVVGVLPRSVKSTDEIWMPLVKQPYVIEGSTLLTDWSSALDLYARLRPGVSPRAAEQETLALAARLREAHPDNVQRGEYLDARPIQKLDSNSPEFQIILTAAGMVVLLLVAACANLGTLVLARGVTREREIRIRMALGAARRRVVRQLFTESLLLAILSALCGLLLSSIVLKVIQLEHNSTSSLLPDWRVLCATFGVALLAALVFGLPPALRLTSLVPRAGRARTIFLTSQVAASFLLLVVSGLLVSGLGRLGRIDPGFDYRHLVWISPGLKAHGYGAPAAQAYLGSLRARALELPDVKAASEIWLGPWSNTRMGAQWRGHDLTGNHVDPQFLDAMGMQLLRGRNFRVGEEGVAIVTEATGRLLWPEGDALGKTIPWGAPGATVIGVVRNASTTAVGNPKPLEFYEPLTRNDAAEAMILVRVAGRPHDSVGRLQSAARALDGRLQTTVQVLTDSYDREVETLSRMLAIITILGTVAIVLSAIGLAGLAGYTVAQRTREIGVRIALGAQPGHVVRAVLLPMIRPIAIGFACGALGGSAVARILRSGIPGMAGLNLLDPLAYLMALTFFCAVVALAVFAPARRAMRINPSQALQDE